MACWKGSQNYCYAGANYQHPATNDSVRKWLAPKTGAIYIRGIAELADSEGDGVYITIKKNNENIWGPTLLPSTDFRRELQSLNTMVQQGDSIYFIVNKNGNNYYDSTIWDPQIFYLSEGTTNSSLDYSPDQGRKNWYYQQKDTSGNIKNLVFNKTTFQWNGDEQYCLVDSNGMHPGNTYDAVRKWIAPYPGKIHINGNYSLLDTGGDGVILKVLKNSELVKNITLNTPGVNEVQNDFIDVNGGDEIIFELNKNNDNYYDGTAVEINIQYK